MPPCSRKDSGESSACIKPLPACCHPLDAARVNYALMPAGVGMGQTTLKYESDRFESAVGDGGQTAVRHCRADKPGGRGDSRKGRDSDAAVRDPAADAESLGRRYRHDMHGELPGGRDFSLRYLVDKCDE